MRPKKPRITQLRLKELVTYDPLTGLLTWNVTRRGQHGRSTNGEVAGVPASKNGYIRVSLDSRPYLAHQLAWLWVHGVWVDGDIDHINGIKVDNRIANLRSVTRSVNLQNMRQPKRSGNSGFLGVSLYKRTGKYMAQITTNYKKRYLGCFETAEEASAAYVAAKREQHEGCSI